ncbi:hypothetical protein ABFS82_11G049800 [Erythranthe guttata]
MKQVSFLVVLAMILVLGMNENAGECAVSIGRRNNEPIPSYCTNDKDCERMCEFFSHKLSCGCQPNKTCCCHPRPPS